MSKPKKLTLKQQKFADEYIITGRLSAAEELAKRYTDIKNHISSELTEESIKVISSPNTRAYQKKAAKIVLKLKFGVVKANDIVENVAVVTDRNDSLVRRWRKKVIERDSCCVMCGETKGLNAHHMSRWADDPINRINIDNGIALCAECHAKQHPELTNLMLSRYKGGDAL